VLLVAIVNSSEGLARLLEVVVRDAGERTCTKVTQAQPGTGEQVLVLRRVLVRPRGGRRHVAVEVHCSSRVLPRRRRTSRRA
jgi:hypothetical protein